MSVTEACTFNINIFDVLKILLVFMLYNVMVGMLGLWWGGYGFDSWP